MWTEIQAYELNPEDIIGGVRLIEEPGYRLDLIGSTEEILAAIGRLCRVLIPDPLPADPEMSLSSQTVKEAWDRINMTGRWL
jgi:hypothetical protein